MKGVTRGSGGGGTDHGILAPALAVLVVDDGLVGNLKQGDADGARLEAHELGHQVEGLGHGVVRVATVDVEEGAVGIARVRLVGHAHLQPMLPDLWPTSYYLFIYFYNIKNIKHLKTRYWSIKNNIIK